MESSNFKNMVVLKKLPSNLVEEAIIILKANKKVRRLEKAPNVNNLSSEIFDKKEKDYILKEAEMLVTKYIDEVEQKKQKELENKRNLKKYIRVKNFAYLSTFIIIIETLLLIF